MTILDLLLAGPDGSRLSIPSGGRKNSPGITRYRWPNIPARRDDMFVLVRRLHRAYASQGKEHA